MNEKETPPALHQEVGGAIVKPTPVYLCRSGSVVKRQPAGKWSENRPDPDGIWREPAPHLMPCRDCGELTSLLERCARCRAWAAFVAARDAGDREQAAYHLGMFRRAGGAA